MVISEYGGEVLFSTVPSELVQMVNSHFLGNYARACPEDDGFLGVALRASACALAGSGACYQRLVNSLVRSFQRRDLLGDPLTSVKSSSSRYLHQRSGSGRDYYGEELGANSGERRLSCLRLLAAVMNDVDAMLFDHIDEIEADHQAAVEAGNIDLWPLKMVFMRVGSDAAGLLAAVIISELGVPGGVALKPFVVEHTVADGTAVPYSQRVGGRANVILRVSSIVEELKELVLDSVGFVGRVLKPHFLRTVKLRVRSAMFVMLESRLLAWLMTVKPKSLTAEQLSEVSRLLLDEVRDISAMLQNELGMTNLGERETSLEKMITVLKLVGQGDSSFWEPLLGEKDMVIAQALRLTLATWEGVSATNLKKAEKCADGLLSAAAAAGGGGSESSGVGGAIIPSILRYAKVISEALKSSSSSLDDGSGGIGGSSHGLAIQEEVALLDTRMYKALLAPGSGGSRSDGGGDSSSSGGAFDEETTHVLSVRVLQARDLVDADFYMGTTAKSDPYCIVDLLDPMLTVLPDDGSSSSGGGGNGVRPSPQASFRTKTCKNTLEPIWNESFEFRLSSLYTQALQLRIMDSDTLLGNKNLATDDPLGTVDIAIAAELVVGRPPVVAWRPVQGERGSIQLSLELKEHAG
jgi:hypothetical protein